MATDTSAPIPQALRIGPYSYQIRMSDACDAKLDEQDGYAHYYGGTGGEVILVHQNLTGQRERVAVMHEALHSIMEATGFNAVLSELKAPFDVEETTVMALAPQFVQFLQDNPDCVRYIMGWPNPTDGAE